MEENKKNVWLWLSKQISQFRKIFVFTATQIVKGKNFLKITIGVMMALFALALGGSVIYAMMQSDKAEEEKLTSIEQVWISQPDDLTEVDYVSMLSVGSFENVKFSYTDKSIETLKKELKETELFVEIKREEDSYCMIGLLAYETKIEKKEVEEMLESMQAVFIQNILYESGITPEVLIMLQKPVVTESYVVGEADNLMQAIVKIIIPGIVGFVIYFLLLLYGQNIIMEVSSEKTSKLMETMLVNVYPEALVFGKILATAIMGIVQVLLWIIGIVVGLFAGNLITIQLYPNDGIPYKEVFGIVEQYGGEINLLTGGIMAIIILCLGILFYCFFAGIPGCLISKPDQAGNVQGLVQIPVIISFFLGYFSIFMEKEQVLEIIRYIPFTTPFVVTGEMLAGSKSFTIGIICVMILVVSILILGVIAGKLYKRQALKR